MVIDEFRDEYSWLSNFQLLEKPFEFDGIEYRTIEHFYQAMKFESRAVRLDISLHQSKGLKSFVRTLKVRPNWHSVKDYYMFLGLQWKFSDNNPELLAKLKQLPYDCHIIEGNWWGDTYWGVDKESGQGKNVLGKMIMSIRNRLG